VTYEWGNSEALLRGFYALLRLTRRRHGLPPQPMSWFRNLLACLGDRLAIHLARHGGRPIASLLTLSAGRTLVYKYGASDAAEHRLGGMPFLFWHAIQRAVGGGATELDLGRTDLDQPGLVAFKEHLGATRSTLAYRTYPARPAGAAGMHRASRAVRRLVSLLPDPALDLAGRLVYRHLG
jgi:CelD/BcsL family acetyltransferase involved in cellulose biosynthesis